MCVLKGGIQYKAMERSALYYIYDPMCSWCWGFAKVWEQLRASLPDSIDLIYLLGGLAPDSDEAMSSSMKEYIQDTWHRIEAHNGTEFNHDFWRLNKPRRSTYPACRAVIAAKNQKQEKAMILAIQHAYYLDAKNPSNDDTLINLALALDLNKALFIRDLNNAETQTELLNQIEMTRRLKSRNFPSLVLSHGNQFSTIAVDYHSSDPILNEILLVLS